MSQSIFLCIFLLFMLLMGRTIYKHWSYDHKRRRYNCSSPTYYSHWDPVLGLDHFYKFMRSIQRGNSFQLAQELFQNYGKTFVANSWGKTVVHTCEPENLRAVVFTLSDKFGVAPLRYDALVPLLGDGVLVTDGVAHDNSRNLMKPAFSSIQRRDSDVLEKHLQKVIVKIPRDGSTIDLLPLLARSFVDISADLFLGVEDEETGQASDDSARPLVSMEQFLTEFRSALRMAGNRIFFGKFQFLLRDERKMRDACTTVHNLIDSMIVQALGNKTKTEESITHKPTFIEGLAAMVPDPYIRRNELLNVFLPNLDTTAIAVSDILFQIARNPAVWKKLRAEVLKLQEPLSFRNVRSLNYLRWVVNEGLRLIAPFGRNPRICVETCILPKGGGLNGQESLLIEKGSEINLVFRSIHRDPEIWGADAGTFRPERWADIKPSIWEYSPFSAGSRSCPGQQMALQDCSYILARLAQTFARIENRDPEFEFVEEHRMGMQSRNGVLVAFPS